MLRYNLSFPIVLCIITYLSNRTGTSVDDGARKWNNRAGNWQRKSSLVLSARFPVVNWRSRSVAKSAHAKVGFAWAVTSRHFAVLALFRQSRGGTSRKIESGCAARLLKPSPYFRPDQKFDTLFHTRPLNQYPISDLPYNTIQYNTIQYNTIFFI